MRRSRAPRVLRGALAASVATFVALLSHVVAGGAVPGAVGIAVPLILSIAVCVLLTGRTLSIWRLSIAVAVSQFLFHTLFVLGAGGAASTARGGHHAHGAEMIASAAPAAASMSHADGWMWLGHAVAAVVTVTVLHRGEAAVARLRSLATELAVWVGRSVLRATVVVSSALPSRPAALGSVETWHVSFAPQRSAPHRRGPPLLVTL